LIGLVFCEFEESNRSNERWGDISITAALLVERRFDVIGMTMRLWLASYPDQDSTRPICCSIESVEDTRYVLSQWNIPYYTTIPVKTGIHTEWRYE
jgi:hypothetical protein